MLGAVLAFVFLGIPLIFVAATIAFVLSQVRRQNRLTVYRKVASRYQADVQKGWTASPSLSFDYRGTKIVVRPARRGSLRGSRLVFEAPLENRTLEFEVVSRADAGQFRPMPGSSIAETGDSEFDAAFLLRCRNVEEARKVLEPSTRWLIREFQQRFRRHSIWIQCRLGTLLVGVAPLVKLETEIDDLIRIGLKVFGMISAMQTEGIQFEEPAIPMDAGDVHCPVCSGPLAKRVVICISCKTPHCYDCWMYNGRCAMFACNETRYYSS